MTDPYKEILIEALKRARRPVSTRKLAKRTRMDWSTAKGRLTSLQSSGKVHTKKRGSKRLWSTKKIK